MAYSRVTVFGGSGFLGRQIVKRLAYDGADIRVAVRRPERAAFLTEARRAGQIAPVYADVWDEASVAPVVDGSDAVINTVGHYVERGKATFEAIHGAKKIRRIMREHDLQPKRRRRLGNIGPVVGGHLATHGTSGKDADNFGAGCFWIGSDRVRIRP
jgi:uncharacterized protein YbjT (DUF2867 family)